MSTRIRSCCVLILLLTLILPAPASCSDPFLREDFSDLRNWEPLLFPKIKAHSTYTVVREGDKTVLKAESRASASAIVFKKTFNPRLYPRLHWRWKVDNLYRKWNGREKSGDDYPLRIYVLFPYDPKQAGIADRLVYNTLKAVYGKYPPHSTLNYVWAGGGAIGDIFVNPFTDKAKMIVLEAGRAKLGQWVDETVNIPDDYRKAFGKAPPETASIAIMNDSDNTGEASRSYVAFIEILK